VLETIHAAIHQAAHAIPPELLHYGSLALFVLLAIGIIGLPIPDETLMVSAGFLVAKGKLYMIPTIIAAYAGGICGISGSYWIGCTAGHFLVKRYGHWFGISMHTTDRTRRWFRYLGEWALFFGYFIPGVRHFTGYVAGTMELDFKTFALFAYSGAIVWASLFLSLGYFFGH